MTGPVNDQQKQQQQQQQQQHQRDNSEHVQSPELAAPKAAPALSVDGNGIVASVAVPPMQTLNSIGPSKNPGTIASVKLIPKDDSQLDASSASTDDQQTVPRHRRGLKTWFGKSPDNAKDKSQQPPVNKDAAVPSGPPYTAFSLSTRWSITLILGYSTLSSSLTANLYFPLVNLLADWYNVSITAINLTITLYVVAQGISPAFVSTMTDSLGRRPVLLFTFMLYTAASLGLFFSGHSYPALLVLRMLQSIGGSATLAIGYAAIDDFTVPAQKGKFVMPMMTAGNTGPVIGPIIGGGVLLATGDPKWSFLVLLVFGVSVVSLVGFCMPEINRDIVGNGAVPARGIWKTWWFPRWPKKRGSGSAEAAVAVVPDEAGSGCRAIDHKDNEFATGKGRLVWPNPIPPFLLFKEKDLLIGLFVTAMPYGCWYNVTAGIPLIYDNVYGFNELHVGLCYAAGGGGIILGGILNKWMMDRAYKVTAKKHAITVDKTVGNDTHTFPLEEARLTYQVRIALLSAACFIGLGWAVHYRVHPALSLVLQVILGCNCTIAHQAGSALLVEIVQPQNQRGNLKGTMGAANNLARCGLSAIFIASLKPGVDSIGWGWWFTIIGLIYGVPGAAAIYVHRRWGHAWRRQRVERWRQDVPYVLRAQGHQEEKARQSKEQQLARERAKAEKRGS